MEIRPIVSSMLRNKTAPLLIAAQVALTLAIICNATYIIRDRLATAARPSGADQANLFDIRFYPHRQIADIAGMRVGVSSVTVEAVGTIVVPDDALGAQFGSDNQAGICPEALAAIHAANTGRVPSYGDDEHTLRPAAVVVSTRSR